MLRTGIAAALVAAGVVRSAAAQQACAEGTRGATQDAWRIVPPPQSSLVYARDGSLVGEIGREWRTSVPLRTLPKYVGQAFVAVEDKRFYQHSGVDIVGVAGALKDAVLGDPRGASTITQQLVGNLHPDLIDRQDRGPGRKLKEQAAAREMEKHYNKEQILEAYINQIHFGRNYCGIESAARHYFGKPAARLTLAEAASLAGMPQSPNGYDPSRNPERNRERRNTVLALMADQEYITREQAAAAQAEPLVTVPDAGMAAPAPYFVDAVRQQAERAGIAIGSGGFRVHTTLDPMLQRAADEALDAGLADVEARPRYPHVTFAKRAKGQGDYLQGAVVAVDPFTGDVRALVGGRDYAASTFNRATLGLRQPGSSFKPIVYAAALAADTLTAASLVGDTAITVQLDNGRLYKPKNDDGQFLGLIPLREALARSRNPVAVQLGQRLGMDSVIDLARRLGVETPIAPYPSSAIGASAVQPLDFIAAYATFANLGVSVEPRLVQRIEDANGRTVWAPRPAAPRPALDPRVAFIVRDMMRDVVERGTATSIRRFLPKEIPVAGKTGTTDDNTDTWFVGMTPDLVAGVWVGFDRPKTIAPGVAGGSSAAPVWGRMMASYYRSRGAPPQLDWTTPPPGVVTMELDRQSGLPADSLTPPERRYTEYFVAGTEPGALRVDPWKVFRWGGIVF
ncbi:MAG TPA: PBP1A family penicillin-binding protein [Gemmatimonadaceae bacterium]|nr:PBP1A family penicillin-binding protein [Gemmatimonadaceae bacterium]